jgi:hypothetical protein
VAVAADLSPKAANAPLLCLRQLLPQCSALLLPLLTAAL